MTRISDYLVERVHSNEASDAERALVLADADAKARLEALPGLDAAFLAEHPVDDMVRRIQDRARIAEAQTSQGNGNGGRLFAVLFAPALAVALALAFVSWPTSTSLITDPDREASTAKGLQAKLRLYRARLEGVERITPGTVAREGDVLQIGVVAAGAQHGVVVSVDGKGAVTLHYPANATASTDLTPTGRGELRLEHGYELDAAPEYERFFLVTTGSAKTDVSTVVHAAEALAAAGTGRDEPLSLPKGYTQSSFLVRKEQR